MHRNYENLYALFNNCVVRVYGKAEQGTGFFVAPGYILTCAHVVQANYSPPLPVYVEWQGKNYDATIKKYFPNDGLDKPSPDLALLQVTLNRDLKNHPCVFLQDGAEPWDPIYTYGYPDDLSQGASATFAMEGQVGDPNISLKFKEGVVRPGLSGAPLLNKNTHAVCGLIRFTQDRSKDRGGIATPTRTIFHFFRDVNLEHLHNSFHFWHRAWQRKAKGPLAAYISRRTLLITTLTGGLAVLGLTGWEVNQLLHPHPWLFKYLMHTTSVLTVAWAPDGQHIASAEEGRAGDINNLTTIWLWKALSGENTRVYRNLPNVIDQIAWSPDGTLLAGACRDGVAYIWNVGSPAAQPVTSYGQPVENNFVTCLAWSPDGRYIATGHFQKTVKIWNVSKGNTLKPLYIYNGHEAAIRSVSWSPDSSLLVSTSQDRSIQVWNVHTGGIQCIYTQHVDSIQSVAWSPDGRLIASGSSDKTVHVWSPDTPIGKKLYEYEGHENIVTSIAWSPMGQRIVSASIDTQAHVWDALNGQNVYIYQGHTSEIRTVSWATKTRYIATAGDDTSVQIWRDPHT